MNAVIVFFVVMLTVGYLFFLMFSKRETSGLKFMLLGISLILVGGIIAVDGNSNLGGFEYFIVFAGLIFSIVGFGKNN